MKAPNDLWVEELAVLTEFMAKELAKEEFQIQY